MAVVDDDAVEDSVGSSLVPLVAIDDVVAMKYEQSFGKLSLDFK